MRAGGEGQPLSRAADHGRKQQVGWLGRDTRRKFAKHPGWMLLRNCNLRCLVSALLAKVSKWKRISVRDLWAEDEAPKENTKCMCVADTMLWEVLQWDFSVPETKGRIIDNTDPLKEQPQNTTAPFKPKLMTAAMGWWLCNTVWVCA